jgi:hypothetical protein
MFGKPLFQCRQGVGRNPEPLSAAVGKKANDGTNVGSPDLPVLPADDEKIRQVITNLVSNAYKFTPEGGTLTLDAKDNGTELTVSVSDTGIGIPKEFIGHLFERFKQVPGTRQTMGGPEGNRVGSCHRQGHRGSPWGPYLGRKRTGERHHVFLYVAQSGPLIGGSEREDF